VKPLPIKNTFSIVKLCVIIVCNEKHSVLLTKGDLFMKKRFVVLLSFILILTALAGCSKKSEFVGSWTQTMVNYDGKDVSISEFAKQYNANPAFYTMTMTLTEDGKLEGSFMNSLFKGTFKEENGKANIVIGDKTNTATIKDKKLILKQGSYIYTFEKDK
jgi:hypothetical protein